MTRGRVRPKALAATVASLAVVMGLVAAPAGAAPTSPAAPDSAPDTAAEGFAVTVEDDRPVLEWNGTRDVQIGGARPEFRLDGDVLGYPREVDGGLQLPLDSEAGDVARRLDDVEVWSGGRRLDEDAATAGAQRRARPPRPGGPGASGVAVEPGQPGRYRTERLSYGLDPLTLDGYPEPIEVLAEVTRPVNARGERPLVVVLHGRHGTCYQGGPEGESSGEWPCPAGWEPIPSHLGYRYVTDVLASQGYITVSISANGINGQDGFVADAGAAARSALVRHHLDLWADWAGGGDPWGGVFRGRVDLDRVGLVGHSRGGEGVHRAAIDASSADPYRIRGIVTYGPTAFGRQVTPDVHAATLLPTCDGDVSDLQGQAYVDESRDIADSPALRSAVVAVGANHNYFNTEWTPGLAVAPAFDDWYDPGDPVCGDGGSSRLSAAEQQQVGTAYTTALLRMALADDRRMLPLLDGSPVKPRSLGDIEIAVNKVGGDWRLLYRPEDADIPALGGGMTGGECAGYPTGAVFDGSDGSDGSGEFCGEAPVSDAPHWLPVYGAATRPAPQALELAWSAAGATARVPVTVDLGRFRNLDVRVATDPVSEAAGLALRVVDARGRVAVLDTGSQTVAGWPGEGSLDRIQARTLRADLSRLRGVDRRRIVAVDVVATSGAGRVWVIDIAASRQRLTSPVPLDLPRVSVGTVTEAEGGPGTRVVTVPVTVEGTLRAPASVWVAAAVPPAPDSPDVGGETGYLLQLPAGAQGTVATIDVPVTGDDLYGAGSFFGPLAATVTLLAEEGAVTGEYVGGVVVVEDDPVPVLEAVTPTAETAEGGTLSWTLRLSAPSAGLSYFLTAEPPTGPELATDDVDPAVLQAAAELFGLTVEELVPVRVPLSEVGREITGVGLPIFVVFEPGQQEAVVEIATVDDGVPEGREDVALSVLSFFPDPTVPQGGLTLTGSVPAHG